MIPSSARQMRPDLVYRGIDSPRATSPVILTHRIGDRSPNLERIKDLIRDMYAENPAWLHRDNISSIAPDWRGSRPL